MRLKVIFTVIFITLLIAVSSLFVIYYIQIKQAKRDVKYSRDEAIQRINEKETVYKSILLDSKGNQKNMHSSKIDVCYIQDKESGWVTTGWYQRCYIKYVSSYKTDLNFSETQQKIMSSPYLEDLGIHNSQNSKYTDECRLFAPAYYNKGTLLYTSKSQPQSYNLCAKQSILTSKQKLSSELGNVSIKILDESHSDSSAENEIWYIYYDEYYSEELGCIRLFFCESPRFKPAQP